MLRLAVIVLVVAFAPAVYALTEIGQSFDQIEQINTLGGTVNQIGGGSPGLALFTSGDFVAPWNQTSGVLVDIPLWIPATGSTAFEDADGEPGNFSAFLLGVPTDVTFTTPSPGCSGAACGPDGGEGDGSVRLNATGFVELTFDQIITAPPGTGPDLFFFTNTAATGAMLATITLLDPNQDPVVGVNPIQTTIPGGAAGSGTGGLLLDVPNGTSYSGVRIDVDSGSIEMDAVMAQVPEPSASLLLAGALAGLFALRRRSRI